MENKSKSKIALIGMPASLKSRTGKVLAKLLQYEFVDTDKHIVQKYSSTIVDIFANHGEEYFRQCEYNALLDLHTQDNVVISTGGGIILSQKCMQLLQNHTIIWFNTGFATLYNRLKDDKKRPLLQVADPQKKIEELLKYRKPLYRQYSDIQIDNTKMTAVQCAKHIVELLNSQ